MEKKCTTVKKVNISAPIPVRTVNPPIFGKHEGVMMTPANILKCLIGRATVYEVLSDGTLLKLTDRNYNKVNTPAPKYPEHKELAKQQPVKPNSFSRKGKKKRPGQTEAMSKDLKDFVDSKFIPQSTGKEKTFKAPEIAEENPQSMKEAVEEATPQYLKDIVEQTDKQTITDDQVAAAQVAAQNMVAETPDSATAGETEETPNKEDVEATKAILELVKEEMSKITYDFNHQEDQQRFRDEAIKLLKDLGGYSDELAKEIVETMIVE